MNNLVHFLGNWWVQLLPAIAYAPTVRALEKPKGYRKVLIALKYLLLTVMFALGLIWAYEHWQWWGVIIFAAVPAVLHILTIKYMQPHPERRAKEIEKQTAVNQAAQDSDHTES